MSLTKRQDLPAGLWIVSTPIGNLRDISLRAMDVLSNASVIFCEDTRRTGQLLQALGILFSPRKLVRLDAHTSRNDSKRFVEDLKLSHGVAALVTDAGTPGVSDPGAEMVRHAHEMGVRVGPIPGASSVSAFISVSGMSENSFTFRGFFPRSTSDRADELNQVKRLPFSSFVIWFESPKRIVSSVQLIAENFGEDFLCVAKELTKLHEKVFVGNASSVALLIKKEVDQEGCLGEWVLGLSLPEVSQEPSSDWQIALSCLLEANITVNSAVKIICQRFDVQKRLVYSTALAKVKEGSGS